MFMNKLTFYQNICNSQMFTFLRRMICVRLLTICLIKCLRLDDEFECKWDEVIEMLDYYQTEQPKIKR
jgi:hypothetical protein